MRFFLMFFGAYGAMHAYLYWHAWRGLPARWCLRVPLAVFLLAMIFGPVAVRLLDREGTFTLARVAAAVTHTWIAIIFWFCVVFLVIDAWNLLTWAAGRLHGGLRGLRLAPRPALALATTLVLAASVWGLVEAQLIRLREVTIVTDRLPPGARPITIAQVTDVHLGTDVGPGRLGRALRLVRDAKPDVFVSTGDLIDSRLEQIPHLAAMLAEVEAPLGKYAVLGNHEYYTGLAASEEFHAAAGLELLREQAVGVGDYLVIVGVDDPAGIRGGRGASRLNEDAALPPAGEGRFVVLLKHQPVVADGSAGRFDLQLSGHTHGGQIFPFGAFTRLVYPYTCGRHEVGDGSTLYVSPGTGTWGPPMRLLHPPEVTLIRIVPRE